MLDIEKGKQQEIDKMVAIVEKIDPLGIRLLTRDANTLLLRQQEMEKREDKKAG